MHQSSCAVGGTSTARRLDPRTSAAGVVAGAAAGVAALLLLAGCSTRMVQTEKPEWDVPIEPTDHASLAASVEASYVVGPAAAREIGYRVDWQYRSSGSRIKQVVIADDSVFALDELNFLTRLRREEGDRVWRTPIATGVERIFGITYAPDLERIFITTGSEIYVLDSASGSRLSKQRLTKTANTAPTPYGQFMLYGSRNGQLVWHSPTLGTTWRAYQISRSIQLPPVVDGDSVVAVGNDGRIMNLNARAATQIWSRKALGAIVASPVAGNGAVYVSSLDQHVRGYDLSVDRSPLWEYLTESPLREVPVLVDDRVYQHVPSEGLVCLEALPLDAPGGVVLWRAKDSGGTVLSAIDNNLVAWNAADKAIELVDARLGAVITSLPMPEIDTMMATASRAGDIYLTSTDGRVERLVPRRR